METENEMLNTLKSIDGTLKRIEQALGDEAIRNAVSHALLGNKYAPNQKDEQSQNRMRL